MGSKEGHATTVWLAPEQVELVRQVAQEAGLAVVAAGSPARGHSGAIASQLGAGAVDDLRLALAGAAEGLI